MENCSQKANLTDNIIKLIDEVEGNDSIQND